MDIISINKIMGYTWEAIRVKKSTTGFWEANRVKDTEITRGMHSLQTFTYNLSLRVKF